MFLHKRNVTIFPFNCSALISKPLFHDKLLIYPVLRIHMILIYTFFGSAYKYMLIIVIFSKNLIKTGEECSAQKHPT